MTAPVISFLILIGPLAYVLMRVDSRKATMTHGTLVSCFPIETESCYVVIELKLKMLVVCWAIMKCKLFVTGLQHFSVITDHHSLILIILSTIIALMDRKPPPTKC